MVFGRGFLWVLVRLFVFYEACSPLPMGEGPGVRSGFGEAFRVWPRHFVGIVGDFAFGRGFSWVWGGISCLAEHFVGIGGHFVFGRAFRRYWWAFRVWQTG